MCAVMAELRLYLSFSLSFPSSVPLPTYYALILLPPSLLSPHLSSPKRFIGYDSESGELDGDRLRHYIYGGHVADYMKMLQDEDEEKYKAHFSRFIKEGLTPDKVIQHHILNEEVGRKYRQETAGRTRG